MEPIETYPSAIRAVQFVVAASGAAFATPAIAQNIELVAVVSAAPARDAAVARETETSFEAVRESSDELPGREPTRDEVALNLARICVNEAGFDHPRDCQAIWEVTRNVAGHDASLADLSRALDGLSARVTGARQVRRPRGNLRFTRGLDRTDTEPAGWRAATRLPWSRFSDKWHSIREWADRRIDQHLDGSHARRVCHGRAIAWGGRNGLDDRVLEARNRNRVARGKRPLQRLVCGVTENAFFGHPPRSSN